MYGIRHKIIGRNLLQVEDASSDSVCEFMDGHGCYFGGLVWSRSVETSEKDKLERILEDELIEVGTGAVELDGVKSKHPGVFVEVLKDRKISMDFDQSSVDKE